MKLQPLYKHERGSASTNHKALLSWNAIISIRSTSRLQLRQSVSIWQNERVSLLYMSCLIKTEALFQIITTQTETTRCLVEETEN